MAKRRKKRKSGRKHAYPNPNAESGPSDSTRSGGPTGGAVHSSVLRRAEDQLARGQTRRAQEGFRRLFLKEPETYRRRYVEVTTASIREYVESAKGENLKAARALVSQMESIGEANEKLGALKLTVATRLGDHAAAAVAAADLLESEDETLRRQAGDALVLARAPEARVVNAGIARFCRRDWEGMQRELKAIPRKSPFAHWRLFLRGCAALWRRQHEEAERCFARLPEDTVPSRKARALRVWKGEAPGCEDDKALADASILAGDPGLGEALPGIQRLWEQGKYRAAYQAAKRVGAFPSFEVSLPGQLTRFFQQAHIHMDEHAALVWLETVTELHGRRRLKPDPEGLLLGGILATLADKLDPTGTAADAIWTEYFAARENVLGNSPRFHALGYYRRAQGQMPCTCGRCAAGEPEHRRAIRSLERSEEADPTFEAAPVRLLEVYRRLKMNSQANRLLDEMTERFPESKTVLLEAGRACLKRKAHLKGLGHLRRAREIDPLDANILEAIREGLEAKALAHYRKKSASQITKARQTFADALEAIPPHGAPLLQSRGATLVRWSCLEEIFVESSTSLAREKFAECGSLLTDGPKEFYRAAYVGSLRYRYPSLRRADRALPPESMRQWACDLPGAVQVVQLWRQLLKTDSRIVVDRPWIDLAHDWVRSAIDGLDLKDRDPANALYAELDEVPLCYAIRADELTERLVERMLSLDPSDPLFRCRAWEHCDDAIPSRTHIEEVRREARRRGDREALRLCDEELAEIEEEEMDEDGFEIAPGEEFEDAFPEGDDPGFFGDPDAPGAGIGPFDGSSPPAGKQAFIELLTSYPPDRRIQILLSMGMPRNAAEEASALIGAAQFADNAMPAAAEARDSRGRKQGPRPPKTARRSSRQPESGPEAVQFDLPF